MSSGGPGSNRPIDEMVAMRERIAELERELDEARRSYKELKQKAADQGTLLDALQLKTAEQAALLDALPAMVFFKSRDHKYLLVNKAYAEHHQLGIEQIVGKRDYEIFVPETARTYHESDESVMASGEPKRNVELRFELADGSEGWTIENDVPYRDSSGEVMGMVGVVLDITARKRAEESVRRTEAELRGALDHKARLLDTISAMSTPILPIDSGILVLPLVGHIDSTRSAQIMDTLLRGVDRHSAEWVILDLTGVPIIDTAVASHLMRAAQAVLLLGAQCILVGISGATAQSLVHIGEDLADLVVLRDLRAGVRFALSQRRAAAGRGAPPVPKAPAGEAAVSGPLGSAGAP